MGLDMYLFKVKKGDEKFIRDNKESGNYMQFMRDSLLDIEPVKDDLISIVEEATGMKVFPEEVPMPFLVKLPEKRKNEESYDLLAYWCKANAIHNWFVNNVQNGIDDGGWYKVSLDNLKQLKTICETVLANSELPNSVFLDNDAYYSQLIKDATMAKKLLPTLDGFFFGETDYDGYYLEDVKNTVKKVDKIIKETDFENYTVFYNAWW